MSDNVTMVPWGRLERAVVRAPSGVVDTEATAQQWGYSKPRNLSQATAEHGEFCSHLRAQDVELLIHDTPIVNGVDACYVCDPALMTPSGIIRLRMGKTLRSPEPEALAEYLSTLKIPIAGTIEAQGTVEGGDCLWLDDVTLAVGETFRTNLEGIYQLQALLPYCNVLPMPMPWFNGPSECLHLQSVISFLAPKLALVHLPFAPIRLMNALEERQVRTLALPSTEYDTMACNILCTEPYRVVMAAGNPKTAALLRSEGVMVTELNADELMIVGGGGPTCLTFPLRRIQPDKEATVARVHDSLS